jgi:YjbR
MTSTHTNPVEALRAFALSLPETTESPHFEATSFRVRNKIFITIPPEGAHAHVFVDDDDEAAAAVERHPNTYEILVWGLKQPRVELTALDPSGSHLMNKRGAPGDCRSTRQSRVGRGGRRGSWRPRSRTRGRTRCRLRVPGHGRG